MIAIKRVEESTNPEFPPQMLIFAVGEQHEILSGGGVEGKWSNALFPPKVGDRVNVIMNGFGRGTVVDYEVRQGWLGVKVKVDKQPDWNLKQNGKRNEFTFFGAEIKY
jgi:hypothetical protein